MTNDENSVKDFASKDITDLWLQFQSDSGLDSAEAAEVERVVSGKDSIALPTPLIEDRSESNEAGVIGSAPNLAMPPKTQSSSAVGSDTPEEEAASTAVPKEVKIDGDLRVQIDGMRVPERIKLAMFGNKQCRSILIFDKNRIVKMFVLKNPKLSVTEVVDFAQNPQMEDFILRAIADSKEWMRDYNLKRAIVKNPKTPLDLSLRWLKFLNSNDIKILAKSKNVPQVLAVSAKRKMQEEK